MVDYISVINNQSIVPVAVHGYQRSHWCTVIQTSHASIKEFQITIYSNTFQYTASLAIELKNYLSERGLPNAFGGQDDVAIGIRGRPSIDRNSQAFAVTLIMSAGSLL